MLLIDLQFYSFPKDVELRKKWTTAIQAGNGNKPIGMGRVCQLHFQTCELKIYPGSTILSKNAVPSIFEVEDFSIENEDFTQNVSTDSIDVATKFSDCSNCKEAWDEARSSNKIQIETDIKLQKEKSKCKDLGLELKSVKKQLAVAIAKNEKLERDLLFTQTSDDHIHVIFFIYKLLPREKHLSFFLIFFIYTGKNRERTRGLFVEWCSTTNKISPQCERIRTNFAPPKPKSL